MKEYHWVMPLIKNNIYQSAIWRYYAILSSQNHFGAELVRQANLRCLETSGNTKDRVRAFTLSVPCTSRVSARLPIAPRFLCCKRKKSTVIQSSLEEVKRTLFLHRSISGKRFHISTEKKRQNKMKQKRIDVWKIEKNCR